MAGTSGDDIIAEATEAIERLGAAALQVFTSGNTGRDLAQQVDLGDADDLFAVAEDALTLLLPFYLELRGLAPGLGSEVDSPLWRSVTLPNRVLEWQGFGVPRRLSREILSAGAGGPGAPDPTET